MTDLDPTGVFVLIGALLFVVALVGRDDVIEEPEEPEEECPPTMRSRSGESDMVDWRGRVWRAEQEAPPPESKRP